MASGASLLFVDAYDSFSQNIVALLKSETGTDVTIIDIDTGVEHQFGLALKRFVAHFDGIVLGPGPGNPNQTRDVGNLYDILDAAAANKIPVLGICLGFQILCIKYGLRIEPLKQPCHGHAKQILYYEADSSFDKSRDIFEHVDRHNIWATCYNSLGLALRDALCTPNASRPGSSGTNASFSSTSSLASSDAGSALRVLAIDQNANVMVVRHKELPLWGMQFHPESCRSSHGCQQLVRGWWTTAQKERKQFRLSNPKQVVSISDKLGHLNRADKSSSKAWTRGLLPSSPLVQIASQLLEVSVTTGNTVQWKRINTVHSRTQISDFVHSLAGKDDILMLESTKKGRFSIYPILSGDLLQQTNKPDPSPSTAWQIQYRQPHFHVKSSTPQDGRCITADRADVWQALEILLAHRRATGGSAGVPFWGGFVGYLSYEHGLDAIEVRSSSNAERVVPDISLVWVERSLVYDNLNNSIYIQSIRRGDQDFIDGVASLLSASNPCWSLPTQRSAAQQSALQKALNEIEIRLPDREAYNAGFHRCQAELHAGNSYELCLTTESTIAIPKAETDTQYDFQLYKNLHTYNPVPFGAFLKLSGVTILGTSPEQYMSWSRDGVIDMIPMKGTVKRSADMTLERASAILSTPKESAENLMIADLIRHDLYNVVGSDADVEVMKLCEVVEHETVYQLVSHIRAHAPIANAQCVDAKQEAVIHYGLKALRETIPPGSMTGAPKKRSCEILSELEQRHRGVYSGVLGYMDVGGGGNWNVCIRSAFRCEGEGGLDKDVWHLGAGGAITVLSDAEGEWQEMLVKLNSVLQGFRKVKTNVDG